MKIVIIGAGEVGAHLCDLLSRGANDVTVIEENPDRAARIDEEFNVRVILGNGSSAEVLARAKVGECDHFLAMTSSDYINLISCCIAKNLGAATTIARIHDHTYNDNSYFNYQINFGIDILLNPEALAAVELAKVIRNPGRVAVENFARGNIEVQQVVVSPKAPAVGKTLEQLKIGSDTGVRIGFVQRGTAIMVPGAQTSLETGDTLTLFGHPTAISSLKSKFTAKDRESDAHIILYGGSETSIALIRLLTNPRFKIRVIEKNRHRCEELAEKFPHVTFINGDATSLRVLEEERVGHADYFIAATRDDEDNVMTCLQTAKLGTRHILLHISRADYTEIVNRLKLMLGVELAVSPRIATANEVLRYINDNDWVELAPAPGGIGKILEIKVSPTSPNVGRKIREIRMPQETVIVALMHKFDAKVPGADDIVLANDRIAVIVTEAQQGEVISMFT